MRSNKNVYTVIGIYAGVFFLLLACNMLTPYAVDDYRYIFSFYDGKPIASLWDIVMSMRVHRYHMNGRIAAHTLVQIFAMLPLWVFDIVNAFMYVLQLVLLYKIARCNDQRSNLVLFALACGAWVVCPAFGQVILWQDGACNYLWSGVFALLYLLPYIELYMRGKNVQTIFGRIVFVCLAFFMGAYSETVSAAAIFMSMLLMGLVFLQKKKKTAIYYAGMVFATLGYLFIYTAPAQWREKAAQMNISVLLANFVNVAMQYWHLLGILLVLYIILLVLNIKWKTDQRRIFLSLIFFAGSLAANFIMMFASYYTTRSAIGAFVFLMGAVAILLHPAVSCIREKWFPVLMVAVIVMGTIPSLGNGMYDIWQTYQQMTENEAYIIQCAEEGIMDVELPNINSQTKYSAINGLKYLDTETPDIWPNKYMAIYYGVDSIIGVNPD